MTNLCYPTLALFLIAGPINSFAQEITIHFAGRVNKPGAHQITTPATLQNLEKACGGWCVFGSPRRLTLIRLQRPSTPAINDPGEPANTIFKLEDIPRDGEKLILKSGDIVFIPDKRPIER